MSRKQIDKLVSKSPGGRERMDLAQSERDRERMVTSNKEQVKPGLSQRCFFGSAVT